MKKKAPKPKKQDTMTVDDFFAQDFAAMSSSDDDDDDKEEEHEEAANDSGCAEETAKKVKKAKKVVASEKAKVKDEAQGETKEKKKKKKKNEVAKEITGESKDKPREKETKEKKNKVKEKKKGNKVREETKDNVKEKKKNKKKEKKKVEAKEEEDSSGEEDLDESRHKRALHNLKETDPEFFNYLKTHDTKLLEFNVDDDGDDVDGGDSGDGEDDELKHIPDDKLEVASDDSDFETEFDDQEEASGKLVKVTPKRIQSWQEELQADKSPKTIRCVVEAFRAALETVSDAEKQSTKYRVDGGAIFNSVVQLCMTSLPGAFRRFLHIADDGHDSKIEAHKAKRFPKIKGLLKSYLSDLIKLLQHVSSADIVAVLLKHLHQMLFYTKSFSSLRKPLLRILFKFWSSGEESVRVGAFVCILRIATSQTTVLSGIQKAMYIKYVENSKFVSPTTLPGINFMRRSLVTLYTIDNDQSYQNAFLYVRQLAIHLRNALTLKKKENFQTVYNWQYINSLAFWSNLIAESKPTSMLRELLYPLVQITIGVIKLIPTFQYYPLRFHCIKMLINISKETGTHIPSLPLIYEILEKYDFSKRHKAMSMKPLSLLCMLRVAKGQARENGFKDAILENVYELILESAAKDSHLIYFPDMYVTCRVALRHFLKRCHVANYCRKIKQLLDKIEENCKYVEEERAKRTFDLSKPHEIESWETQLRSRNTPLNQFYEQWLKVHQLQQMKLITRNDEEAAGFKVPAMKRKKKNNNKAGRDSDEDSDLEIPVEEMDRRLKEDEERKKKKKESKKNKGAKKARIAEADGEDVDVGGEDVVRDIGDWD